VDNAVAGSRLFALLGRPALAQPVAVPAQPVAVPMMPGEVRENIAATGLVIRNAADIMAHVTFSYGVSGGVVAYGPGAKATFQATGSIADLSNNRLVQVLEFANLSASLGKIVTIKSIPVPIPDFTGATITRPVTFVTMLKRGKTYACSSPQL
jgi:hypothetical protein